MKSVALAILTLICPLLSPAALPPARFIVSEWVKNSGSGVYQIEQEVQFPTSGEPLVLKETWWVESDQTLRLQVTAIREFKDQLKLQYVYNGGQRFGLGPTGRLAKKADENFIERYFHFRSTDRLLNELIALKVLAPNAVAKKTYRNVKEIDYHPESLVRMSRAGGSLAYAFGTPSPIDGTPNPGFWIEQGTGILKKFRLPSSVEVIAEKHMQSPRGLVFPRNRTVRWGQNSIQIQTLSVSPRTGLKSDFFQAASLETVNRFDKIDNPTLRALVEDFYLRFR